MESSLATNNPKQALSREFLRKHVNACESESYLGCLPKRPGLLAKTKAGLRKCLGLLAGAAVDACESESEWAARESKLGCLREQPRMLFESKSDRE